MRRERWPIPDRARRSGVHGCALRRGGGGFLRDGGRLAGCPKSDDTSTLFLKVLCRRGQPATDTLTLAGRLAGSPAGKRRFGRSLEPARPSKRLHLPHRVVRVPPGLAESTNKRAEPCCYR